MQDKLTLIRIKIETRDKIKKLAAKKRLKQITTLEYLLNGTISLEELKK